MSKINWFNRYKVAVIFLCGMFVIITNSSSAQKTKIPKEQFVKISMAKFPIADFPKHSLPVSGITVLQCMNDSIRIGFTVAGKYNSVATLTFAKPISRVLQTQIDRMYSHEYKKAGAQIIFVLKELRYTSRSGITSYQFTKFCADAYVLKQENTCKQVYSMDTVLVVINGGDIGSNIENALRVLLRLTLFNLKEIPDQQGQEINFNQIAGSKPEPFNAPILKDTSYREGVYVSFDDFLANRPSVSGYKMEAADKNKISLAPIGLNSQKDTLKIWGLCKGGVLFKAYEGLLVPIVKNNNGFILANYDHNINRVNSPYYKNITHGIGQVTGFSVVPIAFDIINLISRSREPKPFLVKSLPYIEDTDKQPFATCIDMKTGEFSF